MFCIVSQETKMPETFPYFTMIKSMLLSVLQKAQRGESMILKRNK